MSEKVAKANKVGPNTGNRGKGRPKGSPNKATADVRAAIAQLMEATAPKFAGWLERIAEDDPAKAMDLALKAAEYHIPKLARTELTGKNGTDLIPPQFIIRPVEPK